MPQQLYCPLCKNLMVRPCRGRCGQCHRDYLKKVKAGLTTEDAEVKAGRMLPPADHRANLWRFMHGGKPKE